MCVAAKTNRQCPNRVKTGNLQNEQFLSALPRKQTIQRPTDGFQIVGGAELSLNQSTDVFAVGASDRSKNPAFDQVPGGPGRRDRGIGHLPVGSSDEGLLAVHARRPKQQALPPVSWHRHAFCDAIIAIDRTTRVPTIAMNRLSLISILSNRICRAGLAIEVTNQVTGSHPGPAPAARRASPSPVPWCRGP